MVTLRLQKGQISGCGGINTFSGNYKMVSGKLEIGPLMSTRMAGDPDLKRRPPSRLPVTATVSLSYRAETGERSLDGLRATQAHEAAVEIVHWTLGQHELSPWSSCGWEDSTGRLSVRVSNHIGGCLI